MATNNRIIYTLDFKANFKDVQGQLNSLRQSLNSVASAGFGAHIAPNIQKASQAAIALQRHLKKALDPSTGRLDLSRLQTQLSASGQSAKTLGTNLLQGGREGAQAFLQLSNAIVNAQKPMHRFSELSRSLWTTLKNTVKWQISSTALNAVTSALSNSVRFATDLDTSLNKIRIVSGASRQEMEKFAVEANKAAKSLSSSTTAFTDATLIYRQQGDTAAEAQKKAEITIKAANAAGVKAQEMSEYLTGIWNSYQVGTKDLELFIDKLVRVGAVTATSSEELSTSMTKVAATANTVGVSYDQLLSTIATVSSATRTSAETIGTAFKTIYARMGDLELKGSIDEDGVTTTLGTVSSQLKQVGVDVLDANGGIRDMGLVVEDLGNRWQSMSLNQKTAIAEAVAGKRQYTQLFALFDNWPEYTRTLKETANAQGELNKQQSIYEDSVKGAQQRFKAAKEDFLIDAGFGGESIKLFLDGAATVMEMLDGITEAAGGIGPILMLIGSIAVRKMAPQVAQSLVDIRAGFLSTFGLGESKVERMRNEMHELFAEARSSEGLGDFVSQRTLDAMETLNTAQQELEMRGKEMTAQERERYQILVDMAKLKYEQAFTPTANQLANTQNTIQSFERNIPSDQRTFRAGVFDDTTIDKTVNVDAMNTAGITNENAQNAIAQIQIIARTAEDGVVPLRTFAEVLSQTGTVDNATGLRQIVEAMTQTGTATNQLVGEFREYIDSLSRVEFEEENLQEITNSLTGTFQKMGTSIANTKLSSAKEFLLSGEGSGKSTFRKKYFDILENDNSSSKDLEKGLGKVQKEQNYYKQKIDNKKAGGFDITDNERKAVQSREAVIDAYKEEIAVTKEYEKSKLAEKGVSKASYKETQKSLDMLEEHTKELNKTTSKIETFSSVAGATGQSVMGVAMAMSSWNAMFAEGASWTDRIMGGAMLLTSVLSTVNGVMSIGKALMSSTLVLEKLKQIAQKKGIALTAADTAAQNANNVAKAVAKAIAGDYKGLIILGTALTVAATAAIVANTKATDEGAKSAEKYAEAQKQIEEASEEKSKIQEKIDSYEKLSEQLENAANSVTDLTKVQQELRKELGVDIDLVNGGADAQARANAILENNIALEKERLALSNEKLAKGYRTQLNNIDISSVNRWFSTPSKLTLEDMDYAIQKYNEMSDEMQEKFRRGKLGTQTFDTPDTGWEEFDYSTITSGMQQVKDSFANVMAGLKETAMSDMMPGLSTLGNSLIEAGAAESLDNVLAIYEKNTEKIKTYFANKDVAGLKDFIGTMTPEEFASEEEREAWRKFEEDQVNLIINAKNKYQKAVYETPLTTLSDSFKGLRDLTEATSDLLSDFAENGKLNTEKIEEFVKKLGGTETEVKEIQEKLLKANSKEEVGKVLAGITLDKIISNNDLKTLITQEGGLAQVEKIFSENNIRNAKELATQIYNNVKAAEGLNEKYTDIAESSDEWIYSIKAGNKMEINPEFQVDLKKLQDEYGYTEEAAHSLLLQEAIFNNTGLNVSARINALKSYITTMGLAETALGNFVFSNSFSNINSDVLSDEDKQLFGIVDGMTDDEIRLQIASMINEAQNQDSYRIDLSNKKEKEEEDARKDYEKEKADWFKEDDIAKIEDYIERLTRALDKLDDKLSHLDFVKSLYGEDEVPLEYINENININREKANQALSNFNAIKQGKSQYNEGTKEYLEALKTNQEAYREAMLAINTLEDTLETEKETLEELEEQGLEYAEEEAEILEDAAKEALEGVSSLISTIFETIDKVYEASKKLMELWNNDNAASRKSGVASLISASISGSISIGNQQQERKEEKKAIAKRKKDLADKVKDWNKEKEKHTRIKKEEYEEIIKLDREMVDTISDYADESMEQGIIERQADRDKELKEIKEDYDETIAHISSTIDSALTMTEDKINSVLTRARELADEIKWLSSQGGSDVKNGQGKAHRTTGSAQDVVLDDLTKSADFYRVGEIDYQKGTVQIQAMKDGKVLDNYVYDLTQGKGGKIAENLTTGMQIKAGTTIFTDATDHWVNKTYSASGNLDFSTYQQQTLGITKYDKKDTYPGKFYISRGIVYSTKEKVGTTALSNGTKYGTLYIDGELANYIDNDHYVINGETLAAIIKNNGAKLEKGYAKGSNSTPAGEAFVGEEGRELILLPDGSIVLAGQDGIELANLPEGARVLTNEETEKIFKNKKDYANLTSSLKSDSGKKVNYNSYAEGTKGASNNSGSTEDFHKTELKEQEEQNQKIIESLQKRNTQIEQDEKNYHDESLKKTEEYHTESLDSADKYYIKDRQDLGTHQSKVLTQTAQHRGTIQTNTNLANQALINGAQATRTILEETINQMKFTLPAIDSLEFVKSMDKAIQDIFTEVNAERDESGVKVGPSSGGGTGKGGSAEEAEEEKLPQGNDTTAKVWSYYKKLGFSDAGVAGIIGNMVRENGVPDPDTYEADFLSAAKKYNKDDLMKDPKLSSDYFWNVVFPNTPSVKNGNGYRGTDGNYYPGFGVGSFTGPMAQDFLKYAASKGKRWDDLNTQLDYITNRLQSSGKYDLIKNATDYEQAAKDTYLGHYYPGDKSLKFFGSSAVYSGAKKALEKYSNGQYKNYVQQEKFKGTFVDLLTQITKDGIESVISGMINTSENYGLNTEGWMDPVPTGTPITSQFGMRIHPITGKQRQHSGIDFGATGGTAIVAAKDGTVIVSAAPSQSGGYGNYIVIDHGGGYSTAYAHMAQLPNFKVGDKVKQGDVIGTVGSTGNSTGDHLHYEVRYNGKAINPKNFLSYATGGTTKGGKALVGEYGKEIILYPDGTAGLLGVNGMEYADLPAGAQIIPADETERILNNKRNYQDKAHPISSFAKGTKDLTKEEIKQTQKFLSGMGYYIGTYSNGSPLIDGIFGKLTSDALDLYFQNNKDGFASIEDLLSRILEIEEKQEKGIEDLTPNAESSSEQQAPKEELLPITDMMTKVANSMAKEKVPDADKKGIQDIIRDLGGVNWQNAVTAAETYLSAFTPDEIQKIQDTLTSQNPEYYMGEGGVVNEYLLHNFLREQDRISAENMRDVLKPVFSEQFLLAKEYVLNHGAFKTDEDYEDNYKLRLADYINQKNTTKDIEKLIKMYQNVNAPDFTQKSTEIAAKANEEAYRFAETELNNILTEYMAYLTLVEQGSMERDQNYENYISEVMSIISENMEDAAEAAETIKQHFEDMQDKEWTFDTERGTAFGEWNAENDLAIARDQLMTALREDPKNYEKIFDRFTAYTEGYQTMFTDMISQMKTMNDERVEKVQILVDRSTKLVSLTQDYYNEINGLNDTLHTINKELTTAKTKTQWFDEKTKEMIFNEKDYLAISQKVQENLTTAENDRLATQRLINSLGKDEQYKIDHILEAYKERVTIRNKELEILKEELNLTKKQATLNDAIMNRNVRVFSGGRWRQIANIETVTKAQEDFDETKYQISKKQTELTQQLDIDSQNAAIRSNEDKISAWNKEIELVNEAFTKWQNSLIKQYDESTLNLAFFTGAFDAAARTIFGIRDRYYNTYMVDDIDDLNPSQQQYHRLIAQAKQAYEATGDDKYHQLAEVYRQEAATKYNDPGWLTEGSNMDFNTYVQARGLFGENFSSPDTKSLLMTILSAKESWQALENSNLPDEVKTVLQDKAHEEAESARKILEVLDPESYSLFSEETLSQSDGNPLEVFKEKIKEKYGEEVVQSIEDISNSTTAMINSVTEMVTSGAINLNAIQEVFEKATLDNLTTIVEKLRTLYQRVIANTQADATTVTVQSNAQGTADSKPGLSWVNEKGVEMLSTKYGQLIELNPHQKIFNNEQLNYLYEMSKQKLRGINNTIAAMTANNNNSISISDLNISLDNVTDAESFVEELRGLTQYIKNVKTIQGSSR